MTPAEDNEGIAEEESNGYPLPFEEDPEDDEDPFDPDYDGVAK